MGGAGNAYQVKGVFLGLTELLEKAISCAERALGSTRTGGRAGLAGRRPLSLGRMDEATAWLERAIELEPARRARGHARPRTLDRPRRHPAGIPELEKAVAINPQFGYAQLQLANLHTEQGDYEPARAAARGPWICRSGTSRAKRIPRGRRPHAAGLRLLPRRRPPRR